MSALTPETRRVVETDLAEAEQRLDTATRLLAPRRWEDTDPVAATRELSRALAAVLGAVRVLADRDDAFTSPACPAVPELHPPTASTATRQLADGHHHQPTPTSTTGTGRTQR